jgi:alpha-1,3-mannosyltransferase
MSGDLFYPVDQPFWTASSDLLLDSPSSLEAYKNLQPFQVYSSWNALAVIDPRPFLPPHNVRFRRSNLEEGECAAAEVSLLSQDLWKVGSGRVQVIPSVQVGRISKQTMGIVWQCADVVS